MIGTRLLHLDLILSAVNYSLKAMIYACYKHPSAKIELEPLDPEIRTDIVICPC